MDDALLILAHATVAGGCVGGLTASVVLAAARSPIRAVALGAVWVGSLLTLAATGLTYAQFLSGRFDSPFGLYSNEARALAVSCGSAVLTGMVLALAHESLCRRRALRLRDATTITLSIVLTGLLVLE